MKVVDTSGIILKRVLPRNQRRARVSRTMMKYPFRVLPDESNVPFRDVEIGRANKNPCPNPVYIYTVPSLENKYDSRESVSRFQKVRVKLQFCTVITHLGCHTCNHLGKSSVLNDAKYISKPRFFQVTRWRTRLGVFVDSSVTYRCMFYYYGEQSSGYPLIFSRNWERFSQLFYNKSYDAKRKCKWNEI